MFFGALCISHGRQQFYKNLTQYLPERDILQKKTMITLSHQMRNACL